MEWHITYEVKVWFGLVSAQHGTCIGRGGTRVWSAQQSRPSAVVFTSVLWPTHRVALLESRTAPPPGCEIKTIEQLRIAAPGFLPCRRAAVLQTKPTRGAASSLVLVPLSVSVYDCILVNTH